MGQASVDRVSWAWCRRCGLCGTTYVITLISDGQFVLRVQGRPCGFCMPSGHGGDQAGDQAAGGPVNGGGKDSGAAPCAAEVGWHVEDTVPVFDVSVPVGEAPAEGSRLSSAVSRRPVTDDPSQPEVITDVARATTGHRRFIAFGRTWDGGLSNPHAQRPGLAGELRACGAGPAGRPDTAEPAADAGEDAFERQRDAVDDALDVYDDGAVAVMAQKMADTFVSPIWDAIDRRWTAQHCEALAAVANALDWVRTQLTHGVAAVVRVSLRFLGAPELVAVLVGELAGRAFSAHVLWPLRDLAFGLRVVGTAVCAANNCVGRCACARALGREFSKQLSAALFHEVADRCGVPDLGSRQTVPVLIIVDEWLRRPALGREWHEAPSGASVDVRRPRAAAPPRWSPGDGVSPADGTPPPDCPPGQNRQPRQPREPGGSGGARSPVPDRGRTASATGIAAEAMDASGRSDGSRTEQPIRTRSSNDTPASTDHPAAPRQGKITAQGPVPYRHRRAQQVDPDRPGRMDAKLQDRDHVPNSRGSVSTHEGGVRGVRDDLAAKQPTPRPDAARASRPADSDRPQRPQRRQRSTGPGAPTLPSRSSETSHEPSEERPTSTWRQRGSATEPRASENAASRTSSRRGQGTGAAGRRLGRPVVNLPELYGEPCRTNETVRDTQRVTWRAELDEDRLTSYSDRTTALDRNNRDDERTSYPERGF